MKEENLIETNAVDLSNIEFLNQAEEKREIYLFKSIEDAEYVINNDRYYRNQEISIAVVKDLDESNLLNETNILLDTYNNVIFIVYKNNFTHDEVAKIYNKISRRMYETSKGVGHLLSIDMVSAIINEINKKGQKIFGKKVYINCHVYDTTYLFYQNMLIKVWTEKVGKSYEGYFKILTNYSFKIINVFNYDDGTKKQEVELEITDLNGNTSRILLSATDKSSLSSFRKNVNPTGSFLDFMTNEDFNKVINQLYLENDYETIYKYDRPGLIADKNIYLTANEVIELEN